MNPTDDFMELLMRFLQADKEEADKIMEMVSIVEQALDPMAKINGDAVKDALRKQEMH